MTQLTPDAAAVEHRDCEDGPATCRRVHPNPCVTPSGKATATHSGRLKAGGNYADGYNDATAESAEQLGELTAQNTDLSRRVTEAAEDLATAQENAASLAEQLKTARIGAALVPGLQQQIVDLRTERDKALAEKAALDVLFTSLSASDAALRDQVAQLQAQIAELTKPEPPAPVTTLFGMNVSPGDSFTRPAKETAADQVKRIVATYGDLVVAKVFYGGALPAAFNVAYEGLAPGRRVLVCFKSFTPANLKSYLASIPAGWVVTLVYWQEPDDEIWVDKTLTIAAYTTSVTQVRDTVLASAAGKDGRARAGQCFMEFSLTSGRWTDAVVVPGCELIWDAYWNTSAGDPSARIKAMHTVATRLKSPAWGIGEMGDRRANTTVAASMQKATFTSGTDRAAFWTKVAAALVAEHAAYACYFNAIGTTGDHRLIPGEAYSDPTIAVVKRAMATP